MATMYNPPHLGELIRESIEAEGWTVSETAERRSVSRVALSRVLNGRASVSAALALALERIGWSDGCGCKRSTMWLKSDGSRRSCSARRCRRPVGSEGDKKSASASRGSAFPLHRATRSPRRRADPAVRAHRPDRSVPLARWAIGATEQALSEHRACRGTDADQKWPGSLASGKCASAVGTASRGHCMSWRRIGGSWWCGRS